MKINRKIKEQILDYLYDGKVIRIYGLKRSGKTTLCKEILKELKLPIVAYYNCELFRHKLVFETLEPDIIRDYLEGQKLVVLDESQNINNIGLMLKLMVDTYPDIQIIAVGGSSFDLANQKGEPLVGRNYTYNLFPVSISELKNNNFEIDNEYDLENWLRFGMMPGVLSSNNDNERIENIDKIVTCDLLKTILEYQTVKSSTILIKLLKELAYQVGNEINSLELGQKLGLTPYYIEKYISLLEKSFVIYTISSFSRNLKNEVKRSYKVYFWDLGIRNCLIQNYNLLSNRTDINALWENFCISEMLKSQNSYQPWMRNNYFWRTTGEEYQKIDFIIDRNGTLNCFEFNYNDNKSYPAPSQFSIGYDNYKFKVIYKNDLEELINIDKTTKGY